MKLSQVAGQIFALSLVGCSSFFGQSAREGDEVSLFVGKNVYAVGKTHSAAGRQAVAKTIEDYPCLPTARASALLHRGSEVAFTGTVINRSPECPNTANTRDTIAIPLPEKHVLIGIVSAEGCDWTDLAPDEVVAPLAFKPSKDCKYLQEDIDKAYTRRKEAK